MNANTDDQDIIKYIKTFLRENILVVTKEFLKSRDVTSIGSIPIYAEAYINESKNITQEQTENIMFPEGLSPEDNIPKLHRRSLYNKCKKSQ